MVSRKGDEYMTVLEKLKQRRAIRQYEQKPVEREKVEQLLQAATYAPNDRMREPWHFYVLQEKASLVMKKWHQPI